jgi:hypothetical protein
MEIILQQLALLFHFQHLWDSNTGLVTGHLDSIRGIFALSVLKRVTYTVLTHTHTHTYTRFVITTLLPTRYHLHDRQNTRGITALNENNLLSRENCIKYQDS